MSCGNMDSDPQHLQNLLYNNTEDYPGQLSGINTGILRPHLFTTVWTLFFAMAYNVFGTTSIMNHGCTITQFQSAQGATRHADQFIAPWGSLETATAVDDPSYIYSQNPGAEGEPSPITLRASPLVQWCVKAFTTAADLASCEYWLLLLGNTSGSANDPKTNTNSTFIGFGYDTANGDTTWKLKRRQLAAGAIVDLVDTGVLLAINRIYVCDLSLPLAVTDVGFSILWRVRSFVQTGGLISGWTDSGWQLFGLDTTMSRSLPRRLIAMVKNKLAGTARRIFFKYAYAEMTAPIIVMNPNIPFE